MQINSSVGYYLHKAVAITFVVFSLLVFNSITANADCGGCKSSCKSSCNSGCGSGLHGCHDDAISRNFHHKHDCGSPCAQANPCASPCVAVTPCASPCAQVNPCHEVKTVATETKQAVIEPPPAQPAPEPQPQPQAEATAPEPPAPPAEPKVETPPAPTPAPVAPAPPEKKRLAKD